MIMNLRWSLASAWTKIPVSDRNNGEYNNAKGWRAVHSASQHIDKEVATLWRCDKCSTTQTASAYKNILRSGSSTPLSHRHV